MNSPLQEILRGASRRLDRAGVPSAEADALALIAHVLGVSASELHRRMILGGPAGLSEGAVGQLDDLVAERARRVPLQHLTGKAAFRRLELSVGPGVFVPRPETELTAGLAIARLQGWQGLAGESGSGGSGGSVRVEEAAGSDEVGGAPGSTAGIVVDLCTGSGAIALSIKDEVPGAQVHAVELSELAHAWAVRNRDALGLDVDIELGDAVAACAELEGVVDVVVCNPPYIPVDAVPNDPEVRDHDPELALFGGSADGLAVPLLMAGRAAELLRPGGSLVMEHADVQGVSLPEALRRTGCWTGVEGHRDLAGRPRVVTAVRR